MYVCMYGRTTTTISFARDIHKTDVATDLVLRYWNLRAGTQGRTYYKLMGFRSQLTSVVGGWFA